MINLMFGAHCPQFMKMLTTELEKVQNGDEHEYVIMFSLFFSLDILIYIYHNDKISRVLLLISNAASLKSIVSQWMFRK